MDRSQQHEDRILALEKGQEKILSLLEPISETYKTVNNLGRWTVAVLLFISLGLGIIVAAKNIFK